MKRAGGFENGISAKGRCPCNATSKELALAGPLDFSSDAATHRHLNAVIGKVKIEGLSAVCFARRALPRNAFGAR